MSFGLPPRLGTTPTIYCLGNFAKDFEIEYFSLKTGWRVEAAEDVTFGINSVGRRTLPLNIGWDIVDMSHCVSSLSFDAERFGACDTQTGHFRPEICWAGFKCRNGAATAIGFCLANQSD
jgi:hypothetical protein